MEINFEFYKVFYMVAKELSFSKAADQLYISQSAVSQNIRQLETKLGITLFNRTTKQVSLTMDGQALMAHIEPAVNMILGGETFLKESKALKRGQLHIAASDTICRYYLLDYFKTYHDTFPGIDIKVTNRTSVQCVELLHNGTVDLIVTNLPNTHLYEDMTATQTLAFRDVFIANPQRMTGTSPYSYKDLSDYPILMLTRKTATSEFLYRLFASKNISINPSVELGSIDLLVDMVRIDLGIAFVPDFCFSESEDLVKLVVEEDIPERHIGLVTHNRRPLSEAGKKFVELLMS